jgi:hypothetical protein
VREDVVGYVSVVVENDGDVPLPDEESSSVPARRSV